MLLILAAISIMMLVGQNGILNRASESREKTGRIQIIEIVRIDIMDKQTQNNGSITEEELTKILTSDEYNTSGTLSDEGEETVLDKTLTSKDGKYEIPVREIWNGVFQEDNKIITFTFFGKETSCVKGTKWIDWLRYVNSSEEAMSSLSSYGQDFLEYLFKKIEWDYEGPIGFGSYQEHVYLTLEGKFVEFYDLIVERRCIHRNNSVKINIYLIFHILYKRIFPVNTTLRLVK